MERKETLMPLRQLIEMLAPLECLGCGRQGNILCRACVAVVPEGMVLADDLGGELNSIIVATRYEGVVKELILGLKFKRSRSAAVVAARLMEQRLDASGCDFDLVTAVPIAPGRYRERGYNQSELIARELARGLRLPYRLLLGRTTTEHQMGRSRAERLAGVRDAFYGVRRLHGERILIVDDVVTTGATFGECARVLRAAGAAEVRGAAIARH